MALHFEVKIPSKVQKHIAIENLLAENMAYGVYGDAYFLVEGEIGHPTIVFDTENIGRGVEVDLTDEAIFFDLSVPATEADVDLTFQLLNRSLMLCEETAFIYEDEAFARDALEPLMQEVKDFQRTSLSRMHQNFLEEDHSECIIFGAIHPVAFDAEAFNVFTEDAWQSYGALLHHVQNQDLYYAKPICLQAEDRIVGLYVLTNGVDSSFPLQPDYLLDQEINVSQWMVGFFDLEEEMLGTIAYDVFLEHTDTTNKLDAARFIVRKEKEEMMELVKNYGEPL